MQPYKINIELSIKNIFFELLILVRFYVLTHISLPSFLLDIGKQWRPKSGDAECGV